MTVELLRIWQGDSAAGFFVGATIGAIPRGDDWVGSVADEFTSRPRCSSMLTPYEITLPIALDKTA